jgi:hypothetical protein
MASNQQLSALKRDGLVDEDDDDWSAQSAYAGNFGPQYTFQGALGCAQSEASALAGDAKAAANYLIGEGSAGLLALYGTPIGGTNALNGLLSSAKAFLTGDLSAEGFFSVMLAVLGSEPLADALIAAGVGLGVYYLWTTLVCVFTGKT